MKLNELSFEVWYKYLDGVTERRMAAFHFKFEAEKYIELFHSSDKDRYFIKEIEE